MQPDDLREPKKETWNLDGFSANLLYLIPQIALIAFATNEGTTIHDNVILIEVKQMDLTNYITYYQTGSECIHPTSIKLHPALETRFGMEYKDQSSFLNNKERVFIKETF